MGTYVDAVARAVSVVPRLAQRPVGPLIVGYHGIGGPHGVSVSSLEAQLDELQKRRRVLPLREAVKLLGRQEANGVASITFDDGYIDHYANVLPVLEREGIPGCFFPSLKCILRHEVLDVNTALNAASV